MCSRINGSSIIVFLKKPTKEKTTIEKKKVQYYINLLLISGSIFSGINKIYEFIKFALAAKRRKKKKKEVKSMLDSRKQL